MEKRILITGGAGFIGSHLSDELINLGHQVTVLDNLISQVHGSHQSVPSYLHPAVKLVVGDVRDAGILTRLVKDADVVFHLAARVGVGQSMYEIEAYTDVNNRGTAVLMEVLSKYPVKKLITASSMSIYGEGLYYGADGTRYDEVRRSLGELRASLWDPIDAYREVLKPAPTTEDKVPDLSSVYALSKYDQERLSLIAAKAYHIPVTALRFFNVYGTRQSLSNPYTGVLAIFASRYLNGKPPMIFEDGLQMRDFVHVSDVVQACVLAMDREEANGEVFNVGSGQSYTILEIARQMARYMKVTAIEPVLTGKYRMGDIRHCFADITKARRILGFEPKISLEKGLTELSSWLITQEAADGVEQATVELESRGLTV